MPSPSILFLLLVRVGDPAALVGGFDQILKLSKETSCTLNAILPPPLVAMVTTVPFPPGSAWGW
jgi:hypothetical protein